jgi:LCP family protein required for cell wall assembly
MAEEPRDDQGRRVLGRSRAAEPRRVVVDPGVAPAPSAPPARPAPRPSGPPPDARSSTAGPQPAAPPRPWNEPAPPRQVLGSSGGASGAAAPASRPVIGRGAGDPPPPPPSRGRAGSGGGGGGRRLFGRIRPRTVVIVVLLVVVGLPLALFAFGWWQYGRIPKVDVADALSSHAGRSGTNYLIVGTDSRDGIGADDPNAGAFLAEDVGGARTDTIMVLHLEGSTAQLLSVPRDLWVTDPGTGQKGRINSTFARGPANLVTAVEQLGIPVDHYMEINFVSFAKLVDAVGGITIDFPHPAKDDHSGLFVDATGPVHLDGSQALAYVRSRYYTELVDGRWVTDPTADIGRTERQRKFLTALMDELGGERNPVALARVPGALGAGMKLDTTLGYLDALRLGWRMKGIDPVPVALPVTPRTTSGGAAVLELQASASDVIGPIAR